MTRGTDGRGLHAVGGILLLAVLVSVGCVHTHVHGDRVEAFAEHSYTEVVIAVDHPDEQLARKMEGIGRAWLLEQGIATPQVSSGASEEELLAACASQGVSALLWLERESAGLERWGDPDDFSAAPGAFPTVRPWERYVVRLWDVASGREAWVGDVDTRGPKEKTTPELALPVVEKILRRLQSKSVLRAGS